MVQIFMHRRFLHVAEEKQTTLHFHLCIIDWRELENNSRIKKYFSNLRVHIKIKNQLGLYFFLQ